MLTNLSTLTQTFASRIQAKSMKKGKRKKKKEEISEGCFLYDRIKEKKEKVILALSSSVCRLVNMKSNK